MNDSLFWPPEWLAGRRARWRDPATPRDTLKMVLPLYTQAPPTPTSQAIHYYIVIIKVPLGCKWLAECLRDRVGEYRDPRLPAGTVANTLNPVRARVPAPQPSRCSARVKLLTYLEQFVTWFYSSVVMMYTWQFQELYANFVLQKIKFIATPFVIQPANLCVGVGAYWIHKYSNTWRRITLTSFSVGGASSSWT